MTITRESHLRIRPLKTVICVNQFNQRLEQEQWSAMRHFSFSSLIFFCTVIWIKFPGALTCPLDPKGTSSNVLLRDDSLLAFEGKKIYDVFCCCSSTNKCFNGCSFLTFLFNKHLFNNEGQMAPEKQTPWGCLRPPQPPLQMPGSCTSVWKCDSGFYEESVSLVRGSFLTCTVRTYRSCSSLCNQPKVWECLIRLLYGTTHTHTRTHILSLSLFLGSSQGHLINSVPPWAHRFSCRAVIVFLYQSL